MRYEILTFFVPSLWELEYILHSQHISIGLARFQGLSRDMYWTAQHETVRFLRAQAWCLVHRRSHAACLKFSLLELHFCLFCSVCSDHGALQGMCTSLNSSTSPWAETKADTLILPRSMPSHLWSLNLETQSSLSRLGTYRLSLLPRMFLPLLL